jgi:hypothetical protein
MSEIHPRWPGVPEGGDGNPFAVDGKILLHADIS